MRWWTLCRRVAVPALACVLALPLGAQEGAEKGEADAAAPAPRRQKPEIRGGFTFSDTGPDGKERWRLFGKSAKFLEDGAVMIRKVRALVFQPGKEDIVITSPLAKLNRETREVRTDRAVKMVSKEMTVTGVGADWIPNDKSIEIFNDVKVVITTEDTGGLL